MDEQELLYQNYQKLPLPLREYLKEEEYKKQASSWAKKFDLNDEQEEGLKYEILLVLLGISSYDDFIERLKSEVSLDEARAENLNRLCKTEIFSSWLSILEDFKKEIEEDFKNITKFDPKDMEYSIEQLEGAFNNLPNDIKDAIQSSDLLKDVQLVGYGNKLHIDQIGALGEEVGYVLLGLTKINNFLPRVEKRLQLSPGLAARVVSDINDRIFTPMKESLRKVHHIGTENKGEEKETSTPLKPADLAQSDNIFEQKMKKLFSRPMVKEEDSDKKEERGINETKQDDDPPPPPPINDPYREPIN